MRKFIENYAEDFTTPDKCEYNVIKSWSKHFVDGKHCSEHSGWAELKEVFIVADEVLNEEELC